ncbi:MAG: 6,7-dimethyl-8-ribityllumazine synthase [Nitratireductor sp.]
MSTAPNILIVSATFYEDLTNALLDGAIETLKAAGATYECVEVPGVLEIPAAISMAMAGMKNGRKHFDGYITLGCVIRGETTHYDIVCNESARALMDLSVHNNIALGNGIQTVENSKQAWARANKDEKNKGGGAAQAALDMIALKQTLGA